jgi:hypothetical protein
VVSVADPLQSLYNFIIVCIPAFVNVYTEIRNSNQIHHDSFGFRNMVSMTVQTNEISLDD